jgi:hypothetical protein
MQLLLWIVMVMRLLLEHQTEKQAHYLQHWQQEA